MNERVDTKSRILDAAEKLFAFKGFQATSLRDITAEADANLAAVNYHFQSKDCLIDAVIARKVEPVNALRLQLLEEAGPDPTVEQILTAFLLPVFHLPVDSVVPLLGRVMANPDIFADRVFPQHFSGVLHRFLEALQKALPGLDPVDLRWRMHFSVGAMTHTLLLSRVLPKLSGGACDLSNPDDVVRRAVEFLAAGLRAPASNLT